MKRKLTFAGLAVLLVSIPVLAHHNFAALYDASDIVTVTGAVTNVDWSNPHVYIQLDVKDESGRTVNWGVEGYPPMTLQRNGFTRDVVKVGDTITLTGYRAKASAPRASGRELTASSGTKYTFGPSAPGPGQGWSMVVPLR